jgi:hypothetical protein
MFPGSSGIWLEVCPLPLILWLPSLWKLSPDELAGVVNSLQFGIGPWKSITLNRNPANRCRESCPL